MNGIPAGDLSVFINGETMFDAIIQDATPEQTLSESGDLTLITKNAGTTSGRAIAMLTFTCLVDGKMRRAQAVTSIRLLKTALKAIDGAYTDDGFPRSRS